MAQIYYPLANEFEFVFPKPNLKIADLNVEVLSIMLSRRRDAISFGRLAALRRRRS
jgi:hypothetical protein